MEDLAYRRLIDQYYLDESPLKGEPSLIARRIGMSDFSSDVQYILETFFDKEGDLWVSKRCDDEIIKYRAKADSARNANRIKSEKISAMKSELISEPIHNVTMNHEPITNNQDIKTISAESKIPPCPHQAIIDLYHQTLPELPKVISWNKTREAHLKQRWRELFTEFECKSSEEALDWFKNDFFQFIKNSKFLTGRTQSKDRRPFLADLEWVIKPTNFTKIIERKYL
jgi:uncharacterized protein YdaU (DUF1376 family)